MISAALDAVQLKLRNAGVTLTEDDYNTLFYHRPVSCSIQYRGFTLFVPPTPCKNLTVSFLQDQAKRKWMELKDIPFSLYSDPDGNHKILDPFLQACTLPLVVFVMVAQKAAFSDFTNDEALEYERVQDITMVEEDEDEDRFFSPPFSFNEQHSESAGLLEHTIQDLKNWYKVYRPLEKNCEYTRRELISPILVLAACITGVKMACEEPLEGFGAKGPVDWVAHHDNHRICLITEGKHDNITQGLYQNLAQLAAASEQGRGGKTKRRQFCVDLPLCGVATTYTEWIFLRLDPPSNNDNGQEPCAVRLNTMIVDRPNSSCFKETLVEVASRLAGLFAHQKQLVEDSSTGEGAANKRMKIQNDTAEEDAGV